MNSTSAVAVRIHALSPLSSESPQATVQPIVAKTANAPRTFAFTMPSRVNASIFVKWRCSRPSPQGRKLHKNGAIIHSVFALVC